MKNVLICGGDCTLLNIRAEVLESQGFHTATALGLGALPAATAGDHPDAVLICSSLRGPRRLAANQWIAEQFPGTPCITLLREGDRSDDLSGETLPVSAGPEKIIRAMFRLTHEVPASSASPRTCSCSERDSLFAR